MKKFLLATLMLFAVQAQAQLQNPPEVWLGQAMQINGVSYIPVHVNNPSLLPIHNLFGQDSELHFNSHSNLELTGTVQPVDANSSLQGHLNGNYWPYLEAAEVNYNFVDDAAGQFGHWSLALYGKYDPVYEGGGDCSSYPTNTSGILCYLHFQGTGTVRLTKPHMLSTNGCPVPPNGYIQFGANTNPVNFPYEEPLCYFDCGGGDGEILHLEAGTEPPAKKSATVSKRSTWGSIKALYR